MRRIKIRGEIIIGGGLMLLLMFLNVASVIDKCEQQVISTPSAISAFNG